MSDSLLPFTMQNSELSHDRKKSKPPQTKKIGITPCIVSDHDAL